MDHQKRLSSYVRTIDGMLHQKNKWVSEGIGHTRQHHSALQISVTAPLYLEDCVGSIFREGLHCAIAHGTNGNGGTAGDPESIMHIRRCKQSVNRRVHADSVASTGRQRSVMYSTTFPNYGGNCRAKPRVHRCDTRVLSKECVQRPPLPTADRPILRY